MTKEPIIVCPICKRDTPPHYQERHHLKPKCKKGKETVWVCKSCGDMVHKLFTLKELAKVYNTVEKILEHSEVHKWIEWVQRKPDDFSICMARKKKRRR